jgi:hypothetical protein
MNMATEISFYLRSAIEINKKVGGTRAYGTKQSTQKHSLTIEIDSLSFEIMSIKAFIIFVLNWKNVKEKKDMN